MRLYVSKNLFCPVDIPQAYPSEFTRESDRMIIGLIFDESANIPISMREPAERVNHTIPIVLIPIFSAILLTNSCSTIPGTPMIASNT